MFSDIVPSSVQSRPIPLRSRIMANGGAILALCGIVLLWFGVLRSLSVEREQALRGAAQNTANLARAFEENIVRSIKAVDQTLLYVRSSHEKNPAGFDISAWARSTQAVTDLAFQIALIDRDGFMAASNLAQPGTRLDLSDREHFRFHVNNPRDELFISKPVLGRQSNKWSIQLTRKLIAADGSFDGVVVASLDRQYLVRFYDAVDLGTNGVVLLVGLDGIVRARGARSGDGAVAGQTSMVGSNLLAAYANAPSGTYITASKLDGVTRVFAYRKVRDYPLLVSVGIAEAEVLATYEANRRSYALLAFVLSAVLTAVAALLFLRQMRLDRARAQLRTSEAGYADKSRLLAATLENMSQGILMVDAEGGVRVCNQHAIEQLGLSGDLMRRPSRLPGITGWVRWREGEAAEAAPSNFLQADVWPNPADGRPEITEYMGPHGVVLEIAGTRLPDRGMVYTCTDISRRQEYEATLRAARDAANAAVRVKSEFLANMSHEIRSPTSALVGVLELLRETELDPDQSRMAGMVHNSALTLMGVLNNILDFSKIEAGALTMVTEPVNLRELVDVLNQPHAIAASRKGLLLRSEVALDVPGQVEADPLRLRQILNNLLSNAVKFTAAGEIALSVERVVNGAAHWLRFAVRDTGPGMTENVVARLFEPFMQADASTTRDFGGTGLGLCISLRLAQLAGGTLSISSEVGRGSVFALELPLVVASAPEAEAAATRIVPPAALALTGTVLLVDDDPANRWLSQRQLETLGLRVDVAENGEVALTMLRQSRYDLLVTDCHMPRMDGVELTRAVRADAEAWRGAMPIIGLTADVTQAQREHCQEAGMTYVAIKPVGRVELARLATLCLAGAIPVPPELSHENAREPMAFDDETYLSMFSTDDPEGAEWLADYLASAARLVDELERLLAEADVSRAEVAAVAHRLVGASLTVGATALAGAVRILEQFTPSADDTEPRAFQADMREQFTAAETAIRSFLSDNQLAMAS